MNIWKDAPKAYLILEDGTIFQGYGMGATGTVMGEVVFNTAVVGYQEMLTDPGYTGQILTQTFPMGGNYGVNDEDTQSQKGKASGYIVREWCETPSNFRCTGTLNDFLKEKGIVGLFDIDTRALTKKLREEGTCMGIITTEDAPENVESYLSRMKDAAITMPVAQVSVTENTTYPAHGEEQYRVVMLDFGHRASLVKSFTQRGCTVTAVPFDTTAQELLAQKPDGILLSGGPGSPMELTHVVTQVKKLMESGVPILGVGLGHQLMALAQGGEVIKTKHGHRGGNQPVTDVEKSHTFATSQNHSYVVEKVDAAWGKISHINANDKSCEGIVYSNMPAFSVQFYPESCENKGKNHLVMQFTAMMEKKHNG